MTQFIFFVAAIGALGGALGVVLLRNPFYSVLSLAFHLVCLAALFLLLHAEFVAAAQVVVYAGAVMVLYVFVVSYIGGAEQVPSGAVLKVLGPLFALAVAVELCIAMLGSALKGVKTKGAPIHAGFGQPAHIGTQLLTRYLFAFEAASILLLVAAVGAVVLARRRRGLEGGDEEPVRIRLREPDYAGTMAEAAGVRSTRYDELLHPDDESGTQQEPKPEATHTGGW